MCRLTQRIRGTIFDFLHSKTMKKQKKAYSETDNLKNNLGVPAYKESKEKKGKCCGKKGCKCGK